MGNLSMFPTSEVELSPLDGFKPLLSLTVGDRLNSADTVVTQAAEDVEIDANKEATESQISNYLPGESAGERNRSEIEESKKVKKINASIMAFLGGIIGSRFGEFNFSRIDLGTDYCSSFHLFYRESTFKVCG